MNSNFSYNAPIASVESIKKAIAYKLTFIIGREPHTATQRDWLNATLYAVRDLVTEHWLETGRATIEQKGRRVYYLSMEFLMGRTLSNALLALNLYKPVKEALLELNSELGAELYDNIDFEDIIAKEVDPGLGNGGLGRLAACFLDSIATLKLPGMGYGIRYEYGMFNQKIVDGKQVEVPDTWLEKGVPWEFQRPTKRYKVKFGGSIFHEGKKCKWINDSKATAIAYDQIIPGYDTRMANTLRLWSSHSEDLFDLSKFNKGDYSSSIAERNNSGNITRVLYPDDSTQVGRELRIRQEYFLVSASVQDIISRHKREYGNCENLADKVVIHLNDTHPVLAIPELIYILMDKEGFSFEKAWKIAEKVFSYTNHTLMQEALESWPVDILGKILPRHLQIIFEINEYFLESIKEFTSKDNDLARRVSIIDETNGRRVRMAWLAVIASHKINGVAKLHSDLMVDTIFKDFALIYPERFTNMTNGVTPRRWIGVANPELSELIDSKIGNKWRKDLNLINKLEQFVDDKQFKDDIAKVKFNNKDRLAKYINDKLGIKINPNALFDVQIKRIHEYKRQFLNLLHVIARYNDIINNPNKEVVPRVVIFGGKAASAYYAAKQIINLINDVAKVINNDPRVGDKLKLVFIPNYSVSLAQIIIPAADLSEQISLAGTEASGTSNMKFALNGALTIGTLDGANVEILQNVGEENIFIFGNTVEQVEELRRNGYNQNNFIQANKDLYGALHQIINGKFNKEEQYRYANFNDLYDHYQVYADFSSYVETQNKVDQMYLDQDKWLASAIKNISRMGYFSSDRTIEEYSKEIWNLQPLNID